MDARDGPGDPGAGLLPGALSSYRPLADYGLIGDCHTAALVSADGSVDWLCAPRFDSPWVFGWLLDARNGGSFSVQPVGRFESRQEYLGYSGVLRTTFSTAGGSVTLTDFMSLHAGRAHGHSPRWRRPIAWCAS